MEAGTVFVAVLRDGRAQVRHSRRPAAAFFPTKNGGRRPPMLLVLMRITKVTVFLELGRPGWPPGPAAGRRIASSRALWAVPEQDRGRLFIEARMVEGTKGSHHTSGCAKASILPLCRRRSTGIPN